MRGRPSPAIAKIKADRDTKLRATGYVSVKEAAELVKRPFYTLHTWIRNKYIKKIKRVDHKLYLSVAEVKAFAAEME